MTTVARLPATAPIEDIQGALTEQGAVIVENLLDAGTLERLNADIDRHFVAEDGSQSYFDPALAGFFGAETQHVTGLPGKSDTFLNEVLCHPIYLAACDAALGPNCSGYQLNFADVIDRGPGAKAQTLHRDNANWSYLKRPLDGEIQLSSMTALSDYTADMGATLVAPGSHLWDPDRRAQPEDLVAAEMSPGSSVIYLGSTIHAGGANTTTDRRRRGLHLSYCVGWLRTEENHFLAAPPDRVRNFPREVQAMLGYDVHSDVHRRGGFLGSLDWQNPLDLLADGRL